MKISKGFILRTIKGANGEESHVVITVGEASKKLNGMITLNDVAAFIWETIDDCESEDILVDKILDEFDIDRETAVEDARDFISQLLRCGMLFAD